MGISSQGPTIALHSITFMVSVIHLNVCGFVTTWKLRKEKEKKGDYCLSVLEFLTAHNTTGKDKQAIEASP